MTTPAMTTLRQAVRNGSSSAGLSVTMAPAMIRRLRRATFGLVAAAAVTSVFACSTYNEVTKCFVGADCASGVCRADGTCEDEGTSSSSSSSGSGSAGGAGGSTSSSSSSSSSTSSGSASCSPNKDGTITREEVPLAAGLHATFKVATDATFDTAGVAATDGSRTWDLTVPFSGDHNLLLDTTAIDPTAWYAADFPGATYTAKLSDASDLLGVFKLTAESLLLLGVASPKDAVDATKLVYATPIVILSFPLTEGKTWDTLSAVTGKVQGIPIGGVYNEEYTSTVDAHGTLKTPYADFPVLRVHTKLLRFLNGTWMERHTHTFVTECFGTVGTVVSNDYETKVDFTSTSEIWRFSK